MSLPQASALLALIASFGSPGPQRAESGNGEEHSRASRLPNCQTSGLCTALFL